MVMQQSTAFVGAVDRFLVELRTRKPSPHTIAAYRSDLLGVGARIAEAHDTTLDELRIDDIDKRAIRDGFASWASDHAAASVRRAWSAWNAWFDVLVADDLCSANPMRAIVPPRQPRTRAKVIHRDDAISCLLATAAEIDPTGRHPWPARDVALVATFVVTGLRLAEVVGLTVGSFEGPEGARRLVVVGKGGKPRTVPIEDPYERLVGRYLGERATRFPSHVLDHPATPLIVRADTGDRPSRQQVQHWIDKLYRRAGIRAQVPEGALVHALRHTFATSALDHGVDVVELQELLGHASLDTTRRYLEATGARLREAVRAHPATATVRRFAAEDPA
ncbi:MAG: integrase [Actinobacteria bacterium]|nr:integrase [Actinomycetota bacterium]